MATILRSVGRQGTNNNSDVRTVQTLLNNHVAAMGLARLQVDGISGSKTITAIEAFQRRIGFHRPDGKVDSGGRTWQALDSRTPITTSAPSGPTVPGAERGADWPPRPSFAPLVGNDARARLFGRFDYVADPTPNNPENIRIFGDWVSRNITRVSLDMGPSVGRRNVQFHRLAAPQLQHMWAAWNQAGLLDRVLTYAGSFVPRFVRGSRTTLSNHSFGSAFDINVAWNGLRRTPALVGQTGSVRELVPIANEHGFYWGGHFTRLDGMHFEVARIN